MLMSKKDQWILIVEDERPLLRVVQERFEQFDMETVTARSCDQAMSYLDDMKDCSAIWLDHYLVGNKTGLDFIADLKENEELSSIPIFIVTNSGLHDKEQTYLALGAEKYFVKANHKLDEIINAIKDFIKSNK